MTTIKKSTDSLSRMMRELQLLEQGIKIFENKNSSFYSPSITGNAIINHSEKNGNIIKVS
jgi:hypothetical protein